MRISEISENTDPADIALDFSILASDDDYDVRYAAMVVHHLETTWVDNSSTWAAAERLYNNITCGYVRAMSRGDTVAERAVWYVVTHHLTDYIGELSRIAVTCETLADLDRSAEDLGWCGTYDSFRRRVLDHVALPYADGVPICGGSGVITRKSACECCPCSDHDCCSMCGECEICAGCECVYCQECECALGSGNCTHVVCGECGELVDTDTNTNDWDAAELWHRMMRLLTDDELYALKKKMLEREVAYPTSYRPLPFPA